MIDHAAQLSPRQRRALADAYAAFHRFGLIKQAVSELWHDPTIELVEYHDGATVRGLIDQGLLHYWGNSCCVHVTERGAKAYHQFAGSSSSQSAGVPSGDAVSNPSPAPCQSS